MASVFLLGVVVQRFLLRPMYVGGIERRDEYATIITIALMVLFRNLAIVLGGPNQYAPKDYARPTIAPHAAHLRQPHGGARGRPSCSSLLFYVLIRKTWLGRAFRGAAQNRVGIQTAGVDVLRLDMLAFGVGVALAAAAGALLAPGLPRLPGERRHLDLQGLRDHRDRRARARSWAAWSAGVLLGRHRGAGLGLPLARLQGPLRLPAPDRVCWSSGPPASSASASERCDPTCSTPRGQSGRERPASRRSGRERGQRAARAAARSRPTRPGGIAAGHRDDEDGEEHHPHLAPRAQELREDLDEHRADHRAGMVRRPPTITMITTMAISLNFIGVGDSRPT